MLPALRYVIENTAGQPDVIDLLAVTHVDNDHIGGALDILRGAADQTIQQVVAAVWHNSFEQLTSDTSVTENAQVRERLENFVARDGRIVNREDSRVVVASIGQGGALRDLIDEIGLQRNPPEGGLLVQGGGAEWQHGPSIHILGP